MVTREQADALASLAADIRAAAGHGRWDRPGIKAAIGRVKDRSLADVMLAVARAADDPSLTTPGAIGNPQTSCWVERNTVRRSLPDGLHVAELCSACLRRADEHTGLPKHLAHEFVRNPKEPTRPDNRRTTREESP